MSTQIESSLGDELLSEAATAELLGIQPNTLSVWRVKRSHSLPFIKVGRLIRYRRQDVLSWLQRRTVAQRMPGEVS